MAANTTPIFSQTPHVGKALITQTSAVAQSDGASTGATTNLMYCPFKAGANGSYLNKIRFSITSATAATASTASVLRVYLTTATTTEGAVVGATTNANTVLWAEVAVPAITCAATTAATNPYEVVFNFPIPAGMSVIVSQHVAMANAVWWEAVVLGGDY